MLRVWGGVWLRGLAMKKLEKEISKKLLKISENNLKNFSEKIENKL